MLERVSPLHHATLFNSEGLSLSFDQDITLTQVSGAAKAVKTSFPRLPDAVGLSVDYAGKILMRIGPSQIWVIGTPPDPQDGLFLTPLSSSRARIVLDGARVRDVLAACAAVDFHRQVFKPGQFVMTGIHHMPVLVHCVDTSIFHLYVMRTFALSLWEVLADATHS